MVVYLEVPGCMLRSPAAFKGNFVPDTTSVVGQARDGKPTM
jgi:hypothetical protein